MKSKRLYIVTPVAVLIVVLVSVMLFSVSCGDEPASVDPTVRYVRIYDDDGNILEKISCDSPQDNTIDMSLFFKTGYDCKGIQEFGTGLRLFNAAGNQMDILIDRDFSATVVYEPREYVIYFDPGEGSLSTSDDAVKAFTYNEADTIMFPAVTCVGKTFVGWFDSNGVQYSNGTNPMLCAAWDNAVENGFSDWRNGKITLSAQYEIKQQTVTLNYNDIMIPPVTFTVPFGSMLPDVSQYYQDTGSSVVTGFSRSVSGNVPMTEAITGDITLYAVWEPYKRVTFILDGTTSKTVKVTGGSGNITLAPEELPGYTFDGWYASPLLSGTPVEKIPFAGLADTYYAKWLANTYTITFMVGNQPVGTDTFSVEKKFINEPDIPEKEGYTATWGSYTLEMRDLTVYAEYSPKQYIVSMDTGEKQSVGYRTKYVLPVPQKSHAVFDGWFSGDTRITDAAGNSLAVYSVLGNTSVTAHWIAEKVTLYFESEGGTTFAPVKVDYNTPYTIAGVPTRSGYLFDGWYDEKYTKEYSGPITITKDTIVYARWVKSTAISNAEALKAIANDPTGNYHLVANVNLRGENWTPIPEFSGILNGNGYKIYNFTITNNDPKSGFVVNNKGTIKNLTLDKVELTSNFIMSNADGKRDAYIGIVCAVNNGLITNVQVTDSFFQHTTEIRDGSNEQYTSIICEGGIVGCNKGSAANVAFSGDITINISGTIHKSGTKKLFVGGIAGCIEKDGAINDSVSDSKIGLKISAVAGNSGYYYSGGLYFEDDNNAVFTSHIGGLAGYVLGNITNGSIKSSMDISAGYEYVYYHRCSRSLTGNFTVGGAIGLMDGNALARGISTSGTINTTITGSQRNNGYKYVGGVTGYLYNGASLDTCFSDIDITCLDCGNGYFGGIVGELYNGRASNVAYYGTVTLADNLNNVGIAGGLVGRNEGTLTQALYNGHTAGKWQVVADVTGETTAKGSNARCIDEGKLGIISGKGDGSSSKCYVMDESISRAMFYNADYLFEEIAILDAETWTVVPGVGIYLTALANDGHEHTFDGVTCLAQTCTVPGCGYIIPASSPHSFTNYVSDGNDDDGYLGTETAYCDYGCGATDTRNRTR